jgi:SAM-dependent methyltransferase
MNMAETAMQFDDSAAYERFMGRWSRAVAPVFLDWLDAPRAAAWLDVGCGTGILAETVVGMCAPSAVRAVDPSPEQVRAAARGSTAGRVSFEVADACKLPFADRSFDVVASALVINFIPDRPLALAEMRRVARPRGQVGGYVWDFAAELSPSGPLRKALRRSGADVPASPGTDASSLEALGALFEGAGLAQIETRVIEVCLSYASFDEFWVAQTPGYAPVTKVIAAMKESERMRLMRLVQAALPAGPNGSIEYFARAHAIKARVAM